MVSLIIQSLLDDLAPATSIPITGTPGNDTLNGTPFNDIMEGGAGDDILNGNAGDDILSGGPGNDTLNGGAGSDTYLYALGDGSDLIHEAFNSGTDTLRFTDLNAGDISLANAQNDPNDLIITVTATGDTIRIDDQFYTTSAFNSGIERMVFADGTVWDAAAIAAATAIYIDGTPGNDTLNGTAYNDIITGGLGNDTLNGGAGSDTYVYAVGDGNDRIHEDFNSGIDTLRLTNLNAADVSFAGALGNPDDLIITVTATGETIRVDNQFTSMAASNYSVDQIAFADGTTWNMAAIAAATTFTFVGTPGNDTLNGTAYHDVINGGAGNDTINGNAGDDIITGGLGDDILNGGPGSDTYIYTAGDGNDRIHEDFNSGVDVLRLTNLNLADVGLVSAQSDAHDLLIIDKATGQSIRVDGQFASSSPINYGIDQISFADGTILNMAAIAAATTSSLNGTSGDDILNGSIYDDLIHGGAGNDTLNGGAGSDTYLYALGDGSDLIHEAFNSGTDTLRFTDLNAGDISLANAQNDPNDLIITVTATGDTIRIDDQFYTTSAFNSGIERMVFADGTVWDAAAIAAATAIHIDGTPGNDTLNGTAYNDIITGGLGNDTLNGGAGSDTYVYAVGDGNDRIHEDFNSGIDTLRLTNLNAADVSFAGALGNPDDLIITVTATGETIRVDNQFTSMAASNYSIDQIAFADGTTWNMAAIAAATTFTFVGTPGNDTLNGTAYHDVINGGAGNDTINGNAGDDIITGGLGDDILNGGQGHDVFQFSAGDGHDRVVDFGTGLLNNDVIRLEGFDYHNLSDLLVNAYQVGLDTVLALNANDSITLNGVNLGALHENNFIFA